MMFLTKKVNAWQEKQYHGEGIDAAEKLMITAENALDNIPMAILKFICTLPMLYTIAMMYDFAIAHHLQYDLSMVILVAELVYIVPAKNIVLKIVDLPMLVFNTIVCHPIASYGYAVAVPCDLIALAVIKLRDGVKALRARRNKSSNTQIIDAKIVNGHH